MKACIINKYGPPEVLELVDMEKPTFNDDQVLVENYATSVNPVDWKIRSGALKFLTGNKFPKVLGGDFAGVVVAAGKNVTDFKIGDAVYGTVNAFKGSAYAEYVVALPGLIAVKPPQLSFVQAATLPIAGLTALQALTTFGHVGKGQTVFVNGCTGGVGSFAVQIAKAKGARVTGTCSKNNIEFAKELGADTILDYKDQNSLKAHDTYDIFFDAAGKAGYFKVRPMLKKRGIYITTMPGMSTMVFGRLINLASSKKIKSIMVKSVKQDLESLNDLIKQGSVKSFIFRQFPFDQMAQAHALCESGRITGKVGIVIKPE